MRYAYSEAKIGVATEDAWIFTTVDDDFFYSFGHQLDFMQLACIGKVERDPSGDCVFRGRRITTIRDTYKFRDRPGWNAVPGTPLSDTNFYYLQLQGFGTPFEIVGTYVEEVELKIPRNYKGTVPRPLPAAGGGIIKAMGRN